MNKSARAPRSAVFLNSFTSLLLYTPNLIPLQHYMYLIGLHLHLKSRLVLRISLNQLSEPNELLRSSNRFVGGGAALSAGLARRILFPSGGEIPHEIINILSASASSQDPKCDIDRNTESRAHYKLAMDLVLY